MSSLLGQLRETSDYIRQHCTTEPKVGGSGNVRLNANVQNVFTITKYQGLDPEIGNGIDNNFYPRPRTYTIGVNLDF